MNRFMWMLCVLLLLVGCASQPADTRQSTSALTLPPGEIAARRNLVFLVDSGGDPVLREAAELFADKLTELTGGGLVAQVSSSVSAAEDFRAGRAQIAFLDSGRVEDPTGDFALLSGPMRYRDYETFTMGLNSARMLEMLNDRLAQSDTRLLAAFYQGSNQLIADRAPVRGNLLGDPVDDGGEEADPDEETPVRYGELSAALRSGSGMGPLLEEYGMQTVEERDFDARVAMLAAGEVNLAEFSPAELERVDLPPGMCYLVTRHSVSPLWLAMRPSVFDELPSVYQAAVLEACAYLFPVVDESYLERDEQIAQRMLARGAAVETRLDGLRAAAQLLGEREAEDDLGKRYLLSILAELS